MILSQKNIASRCILKITTGRLFYGKTNPQKGSVEKALCVACGKCAKECPASVITMQEAAQ